MSDFKKVGECVWEKEKSGNMRVPVRIYANEKLFNGMQRDRSISQALNVASLPGIVRAAMVMPDGHEGYGFPIGGVAAFDPEEKGIVSPGGVGYDINCGVRSILTGLDPSVVRPKIGALMTALFNNIPSGVGSKSKLRLSPSELDDAVSLGAKWAVEKGYGTKEDLERIEENGCMAGADPRAVSDIAKKRGAPQFGTLGSGNHFLEVQEVKEIFDEATAKTFGLEKGKIVIMLHCGSRGFGHQVCDDAIRIMVNAARKYGIQLPDQELCCAPLGTPEADNYLKAMNCAINYAFCNRQVMTHWIRQTFEQIFPQEKEQLNMGMVYDVCHNLAKFEEHEVDGKKKKLCVHRKGATRAMGPDRPEVPSIYRSTGQPVIIPGSMGTSSYILCGIESAKETFYSTCHGAGRVMSRHEAIRQFGQSNLKQQLEQKGISLRATGTEIIAEEAPQAYKDVNEVVQSVAQAGISKIVAKLVPLGVAKG